MEDQRLDARIPRVTLTNEITCRQYLADDEDAVIAIFRSNIPKYFTSDEEQGLRDFLRDVPQEYYVIGFGNDVIGAGGIGLNTIDEPTVSLCWGMVHSDYLGKGLGKQLTHFRIGLALEKYGPLPMVINTSQHTQGFYEKFGFRLVRHEPDGFSSGIDICEMRMERTVR
jgi:GNAT superfamily N-acetyltransferase